MFAPLISIIVPVYNTAQWLQKCLDSICNQTYRNLEIICVNDGSTDGSGDILDAYAVRDVRIKVIHQENAGQAVARNVGMQVATGDFVSWVDSDDYIRLDAYSYLLPYLQEGHDLVCFGGKEVDAAGNERINDYMRLPAVGMHEPETNLIAKTNSYLWNKVFKLKKVREWNICFPEELKHEDAVYVYAYLPQCQTICYVNEPLYFYLHRQGSLTNSERMKYCAFDFCLMLESIFLYYKEKGLMPKWKELYHQLFMSFFEHTFRGLPRSVQRRVMKTFHDMVLRTGMYKFYPGQYPYQELKAYNSIRQLFYWRTENQKVYKFLKWPILLCEKTGQRWRWRWYH